MTWRKTNQSGSLTASFPGCCCFWITTEALQTKDQRLELGQSPSEFMRWLVLTPTQAEESAVMPGDCKARCADCSKQPLAFIRRWKKITDTANVGLICRSRRKVNFGGTHTTHDPEQGTLWGSYGVLGEHFYKAITSAAVPVDMRVLRAIKLHRWRSTSTHGQRGAYSGSQSQRFSNRLYSHDVKCRKRCLCGFDCHPDLHPCANCNTQVP